MIDVPNELVRVKDICVKQLTPIHYEASSKHVRVVAQRHGNKLVGRTYIKDKEPIYWEEFFYRFPDFRKTETDYCEEIMLNRCGSAEAMYVVCRKNGWDFNKVETVKFNSDKWLVWKYSLCAK